MATVANDPAVQKGLPQALLPNMKGHKKQFGQPQGIKVMGNANGCSTVESMIEYFTVLIMGKKTIFWLWTALTCLTTPCSG